MGIATAANAIGTFHLPVVHLACAGKYHSVPPCFIHQVFVQSLVVRVIMAAVILFLFLQEPCFAATAAKLKAGIIQVHYMF